MAGRRRTEAVSGLLLVLMLAARPAPANATTLARTVFNGSRGLPVVALTFDDGNDAAQVRLIFDTLRAAHVPATFFPYAQAMNLDPRLWRGVAAAGYAIGNHSLSHADLLGLTAAALRREISDATSMIRSISGRPPIPVLRPPYGAFDARVAAAAAAAGYPTLLLWDVDPRDWTGIPAATMVERVLAQVRDGSVILLHAGPYHTAAALPAILVGLARLGFRFATVSQLLTGNLRAAVAVSGTELARLASATASPVAKPSPGSRVAATLPSTRPGPTIPHGAGIASSAERGADGASQRSIADSGLGEQQARPEAAPVVPLAVLSGTSLMLILVARGIRRRRRAVGSPATERRAR